MSEAPGVFLNQRIAFACIKHVNKSGMRILDDEIETQRFEERLFGEKNHFLTFVNFLEVADQLINVRKLKL